MIATTGPSSDRDGRMVRRKARFLLGGNVVAAEHDRKRAERITFHNPLAAPLKGRLGGRRSRNDDPAWRAGPRRVADAEQPSPPAEEDPAHD